jgi:hypothetical protein
MYTLQNPCSMAEKSQGTKLGGVKNITSSRFYDNCGIGKDVS